MPPLALLQSPQARFASWIRVLLVVHPMIPFEIAGSSWSPNAIAIRPCALALAYLLVLVPMVAFTRTARSRLAVLAVATVLDRSLPLHFARTPSLTIY